MMKHHHSICMLLLCAVVGVLSFAYPTEARAEAQEMQQSQKASGVVLDERDEPLPGASIVVVNTRRTYLADANGRFSIDGIAVGTQLRVSYIGCKTQVVKWEGQPLTIRLEDDNMLGEAVVTAMGIVRKEKSLTYATQQIKSEDLMRVQDVNLANSLEGKISGVTITPSAGGAGGASKIVLRGLKSLNGSSNPLIVVDGVPMNNDQRGGGISDPAQLAYERSAEGGDPLSMINPDDIESINVLKGANAAALYGSRAANGVLMITTKKGREGTLSVNYSGNITIDVPLLTPKIQNTYGAPVNPDGTLGEANGWGGKIADSPLSAMGGGNVEYGIAPRELHLTNKGKNTVDDFYRTGWTTNNSLSLAGGTEKIQTYVSFANSHSEGLIDNNNYNRNTIAFRQTYKFWKRVKIDASLNYVQTKTKNRLGGGTVLNPIYHLYLTPRNIDMSYYKSHYAIENGEWLSGLQERYVAAGVGANGPLYEKVFERVPLKGPMQDWIYAAPRQNNPYWLLNRTENINKEDRVYGGFAGTVDIWDGLTFQARVNFDHTKINSEGHRYASTWGPSDIYDYGTYNRGNSSITDLYTDFLLSYNKTFNEDWSVSATAGWVGHTRKTSGVSTYVDRATAVFVGRQQLSNYINIFDTRAGGTGVTRPSKHSDWDKAALFTAQLGWQEKVYVDFSYRQDWYRAFRQFRDRGTSDNYGYFSVGANALISDLAKLPEWWNYFKLRMSYSEVGNSIPNMVYDQASINWMTGALERSQWASFENPIPEKTKSFEVGTEMLFFDNRLSFDFTFYNAVVDHLYMIAGNASGVPEPVNSARVRNTGFETTLGYNFRFGNDWRWRTSLNMSYNDNKILRTSYNPDGSEKLIYSDVAGVRVRFLEGGSMGDMYIRELKRNEDGTIYLTESGNMIKENRYTRKIGNMHSKVQLGWSNTINYKDFQLSFLINGRIGGKVISLTEAYLDEMGFSQRSADARLNAERNNLYLADGTPAMYLPDGSGRLIGVENYYKTVGANGNQYSPNYVYSATNFRLRELSLAYTFRDLFGEGKNLSLSFIARNLFFLYKDAPVDPDVSLSTNQNLMGFELFNLPPTRSFGFNVKLNF